MTGADESKEKFAAPIPEWPEAPKTSAPARGQGSYFSRRQLVTIVLSFMITASAAGFSGFIAGKKIFKTRHTGWQLLPAHQPQLAFVNDDSPRSEPAAEGATADTKPVEAKPVPKKTAELPPPEVVDAATRDGPAAGGKIKTSLIVGTDRTGQANDFETKPVASAAVKRDFPTSPWSVQISATQDQTAAQLLQEKLKSKGFNAFIVEAEINSNHWYRVRVGRFNTNQEAEKARQELQARENLVSAFVTGG